MRGIRAIAAAILAACISFCVGFLSANPIETRMVPDERAAASARIIESLTPEKFVTAFALRFGSTTFGLGLET